MTEERTEPMREPKKDAEREFVAKANELFGDNGQVYYIMYGTAAPENPRHFTYRVASNTSPGALAGALMASIRNDLGDRFEHFLLRMVEKYLGEVVIVPTEDRDDSVKLKN